MSATDDQLIMMARCAGIVVGFFLGIVFISFWFCFLAGETILKILFL